MPAIRAFVTGDLIVEEFVLSVAEASAQAITLSQTPGAGRVALDAICGPAQSLGFDFEVIGNTISWNGKALETILEAGDKLRVIYSK